ncbi:MAG: gamma-glutamyltransferase [Candidatus Krumholzibacteriota bacterium]|nr:gamma-glutamyltransferase [Candidatus Krumholzibacteriota bacterium]
MIDPKRILRILTILAVLTVFLAAGGGGALADRNAKAVYSDGDMVSTSSGEATRVGVEVLKAGGNAIDAAVAVSFALAVTHPSAGNIGGGGFLLFRDDSGENHFIDFREKAPAGATEDFFLDIEGNPIEGMSRSGHNSVGVPGTVAGIYLAWERFGSMPWKALIDPAVRLAEEGFTVDGDLAASLLCLKEYRKDFPLLDGLIMHEGRYVRENDTLSQPQLARTLGLIARDGPDAFYRGKIAAMIVREMEAGGGSITAQDLREYKAVMREPVVGSYRGHIIISAPPPSSGGIVLIEILNILEGFDLGSMEYLSDRSVHLIVEAEKFAYRDRACYLGDPDFVEIPIARLLSKGYARSMRDKITASSTDSRSIGQSRCPPGKESEETTHYSIIDRSGNAVAVTTTLNSPYGSKVVVKGAGFLLNNEMDDFSIKPGAPNIYGLTGGKANAIAPGKRMLSSMTPTIVLRDDRPFLILGSPGGSTIITTVAQLITDIIDFCLSPEEAIASGRYHHQWIPDIVYCEKGVFSSDVAGRLMKRGHKLKERSSIGDAQLIMIQDGRVCGVSDPRHAGTSAGSKSERTRE